MSWTNDVVLEFLDHYRTEQLLWDPKHPLHRNRSEVNDAWRRIQNNLSITSSIIDLKKKKESLMTSFRLHLNRKKKSPNEYRITWFAYPLMESFLGGKYECDSSIQMDHEYESSSNYNSTYNTRQVSNHNQTNSSTVNSNTERQSSNKRQNRPSGSKGQLNNEYIIYAKNEMEDVGDYLKNVSDFKKDKDEYELYGQLLAKKLRKLDERQRDIAMHEIDNIMFNAKMQSQSAPARSFSSSPPPVNRKIKSPMFIVQQHFDEDNITYTEA
ncbi:uncharacterized protein LOC125067367 [Vanessa atalanta]|uniref:uncharacterized protein LOC125067367 n=1 Tax=Vanessa atalanta TaxID=42275 RepID=UPI001FCD8025|nr:uncharacterized protein LOC125067367 [Vanessa atalanta]